MIHHITSHDLKGEIQHFPTWDTEFHQIYLVCNFIIPLICNLNLIPASLFSFLTGINKVISIHLSLEMTEQRLVKINQENTRKTGLNT